MGRAFVRIRTAALLAAAAFAFLAAVAAAPPADPDALAVNRSVRPGDDFYQYANGPWTAATTVPAGRSSFDTTTMLVERNARRVRALIEVAASGNPAETSPANRALARMVGDYYASQLDEAGIEAKGLAPLAPELAAIRAIGDRSTLAAALGRSLRLDDGNNNQTESLLGLYAHQGFTETDRYEAHLVEGGLGLPDIDDYLGSAARNVEHRDLYRTHVAAVLTLAGFDRADERAANVLALETAIAKTHASRTDTDDPAKTNNRWRRSDFEAKAPGLDWSVYFHAARLDRQPDFLVWQPSAVIGASALAASQPIDAWKDYLAFHLIDHAWAVLPKAVRDEHSAFVARLSGRPAASDGAQRAIAATNAAVGEAVGRLYVVHYFPPAAKAAAADMAENLRAAFRARITNAAWMTPATRAKALAKLAALNVGVGYPDRWTDYSGLKIVRGDAYGNLRRAEDFAYGLSLAKLGRPTDPGEWSALLPQTAGALLYISPNTMQFAAGILQPPYFNYQGDLASNYGSAGAGMAHEFSHSFDQLGRFYDAQGRFGDWWTPEDAAHYREAAAPLVAQFGAYCPQVGLCLRGDRILDENIGDLVGLRVAHDAYLRALHGRPDGVKNGLTGEQRFFLAFARRWRRVQTDAAFKQQVAADSHAPGAYRTATVRNLDAWYGAFAIKPGDRLYLAPAQRVGMW